MFKALLCAVFLACATSSAAGADPVIHCRHLAEADQRLACYDAAVDQLLIDNAPEVKFGEPKPAAAQPVVPALPPVESVAAAIAQLHTDPRGKWVLDLDNGQTWVQTDSRRLNFTVGDKVVIHTARFGGYQLEKASGSRAIAVKRTH